VGGLGLTAMLRGSWPETPPEPVTWRGVALGAKATMTLYHPDRAQAQQLIRRSLDEIARLERVFSLYRPDSALSILNQRGALAAPPPDLVRLLTEARSYAEATAGAFDVTVQPLWDLYARHFKSRTALPAGPDRRDIDRTLARIDYRAVSVDAGRIAFEKPGMAITLNGIAQGYITDRVADLLRGQGVDEVLIDLGEIRALGRHPAGRPWRAGIADPRDPDRSLKVLPLTDRALATSAGAGTRFEPSGRHHHLFDPKSGRSSNLYASVSVTAPRATQADALSTAFASMSESEIAAARRQLSETAAILVHNDGTITTLDT
jgi:thiamine biosynthesis lipoprotein